MPWNPVIHHFAAPMRLQTLTELVTPSAASPRQTSGRAAPSLSAASLVPPLQSPSPPLDVSA